MSEPKEPKEPKGWIREGRRVPMILTTAGPPYEEVLKLEVIYNGKRIASVDMDTGGIAFDPNDFTPAVLRMMFEALGNVGAQYIENGWGSGTGEPSGTLVGLCLQMIGDDS